MELDKIQLQTTWNDAAGSINQNFAKLVLAIATLQAEGGGLDEAQLEQYLTDNGYTKQEWVLAQKYITQAALEGFATEDWVNQQKFLKGIEGSAFISVSQDNIISLDVDDQGGLGATEQGLGIVSIPDEVLKGNLKTINGESLVGKGNIIIQGGGGGITNESDPVFKASPAAKITDEDIERWNTDNGADIVMDTEMSDTSENAVQNKVIKEYVDLHPRYETIEEIVPPEEVEDFATKQWVRDSFTEPSDFKTINGQSIVGEGDIELNGGKVTLDTEMSDESENGVQNKVIKAYVDGKVKESYINVTYEELISLMMYGKLIKGAKYRIIDYVTTTIQEGTRSKGKVFDIVIEAISEWYLSEDAIAVDRDGDITNFIDGYLPAWKLKYSPFPAYPVRFSWAALGNEYVVDIPEDEYPNSVVSRVALHRLSSTYTESFMGKQCYCFYASLGIFTIIAYCEKVDPQVGDIFYLDADESMAIPVSSIIPHEEGKGVIYEMTDEWGNSAPYDFKNIQFRVYSANTGMLFPDYSFKQEDGMEELWAYTFWGGADEDLSTIGFAEAEGVNSSINYAVKYCVANNKVRYFPYTLQPLVCMGFHMEQVGGEYDYLVETQLHDNEFTNCNRVLCYVHYNGMLRNCEDVTFKRNNTLNTNIHIDCLKGEEGNPIVIDNLTTSEEYTTHIGKNSQGEVKIWNPADLV